MTAKNILNDSLQSLKVEKSLETISLSWKQASSWKEAVYNPKSQTFAPETGENVLMLLWITGAV